ncbi:toxin-antitoxin system YwqK family antitoxin [Christiangramia aquimixticola]|uniref:toxin-antitoxin system YwqK family antitoxin n=1 Tax=Christiangramia aquimixticola TaxID=1697558 RepID=UPI003AA93B09
MHIQKIFFLVLLIIPSLVLSQTNQLDAQGKKHGDWKVYFEGTKNPRFEGRFEHGKEIGEFKFYKKGFYDHPAAIMNFEKNKDSVNVTYYTQKGEPISNGKMVDRKREGKWVYFHQASDSIMMTEQYQEDKLNGLQQTYYKNGKLAEKTTYKGGEKNGTSLIFAENGQITRELNFKAGKLHGKATYFTPEGEKTMEGFYTEGNKSGIWKYYTEGKLVEEKEY